MRKWLAPLFALTLIAAPASAIADSQTEKERGLEQNNREAIEEMARDAGKAAGEALANLLSMLQTMVKTAPWYEAPEVLDNGDIIIRRKHPEDETPDKPKQPENPDIDETRT